MADLHARPPATPDRWLGFQTLFKKEMLRFWKVGFQTVAAPVLTALLYLLIFAHVLDSHVAVHGVRYAAFLIPGLARPTARKSSPIGKRTVFKKD